MICSRKMLLHRDALMLLINKLLLLEYTKSGNQVMGPSPSMLNPESMSFLFYGSINAFTQD